MAEAALIPVVLPVASGKSPTVDLDGVTIVEIFTPSAWTAAAPIIGYSAPSDTAALFVPMYDDNPLEGGVAITHAADASRAILVDELIYVHRRYVQFSAASQAAARTIILRVVSMRSLARNQV